MAPRIRPCLVLVSESTGANALRCLRLRSCLSSSPADEDPGVNSRVSKDEKHQLGLRAGVCACDAAARGVTSLPSFSLTATASPETRARGASLADTLPFD